MNDYSRLEEIRKRGNRLLDGTHDETVPYLLRLLDGVTAERDALKERVRGLDAQHGRIAGRCRKAAGPCFCECHTTPTGDWMRAHADEGVTAGDMPADPPAWPASAQHRYVCGFAFTRDGVGVVLIRKARPEWQRGKLNGVGGHIEPGETPLHAMEREFTEEAGQAHGWQEFAVLGDGESWAVHFFRGELDEIRVKSDDEPVGCFAISPREDMVPNLRWLIPMALRWRPEDGALTIFERAQHNYADPPAPDDAALVEECVAMAISGMGGTRTAHIGWAREMLWTQVDAEQARRAIRAALAHYRARQRPAFPDAAPGRYRLREHCDAIQFTGDNHEAVKAFLDGHEEIHDICTGMVGMWTLRDSDGFLYNYTPSEFAAKYEPAIGAAPAPAPFPFKLSRPWKANNDDIVTANGAVVLERREWMTWKQWAWICRTLLDAAGRGR